MGDTINNSRKKKSYKKRKRAEEELCESEAKCRSLFEHMLNGFAYCQMLYDQQGKPEDFIYLAVNRAFGRLTGLADVIGKRATQVIPKIRELNPELLEVYGRVARTGDPEKFEIDFKPLSLYLSISVYSPTKGYFIAIFEDVTDRKRAEAELRESRAQFEAELADTKLLQCVSTELFNEDNIQTIYDKIMDAAVRIMHSEYASIQMFYPERGIGGELRLLAFRGFNQQAAKFWEWVGIGSEGSTCGAALRTGLRVIVPDVEKCDQMQGTEDLAMFLQNGIHACQTTPLVSRGGTMVGMISTHWRNPHEPSEHDLRMLDILARQAADLIERQQAEKALRDSEELLRAVTDNAPDAIYVKDRESRWLMANPAVLRIVGKTAQQALGKTDMELYTDPMIGHAILENDRRIIKNGTAEAFEEVADTPKGRRTFLSVKAPRRDTQGNIIGIIGISHDITDRKRAEQALRKSEAKANALIKYAPSGICEVDYRGPSFISVNDAMCQVLGYTREELLSIGPSGLVDDKDQARYADRVRRQLAGEKIDESVEYCIRKKDGSLIDAILNISFNHTGDDPYRAMIIVYDITERKQAEKAIRESEERFRRIADLMPQLVWTAGPNGKVDYVNVYYQKYTGLSPETAVHMFDLIHPEDIKRCEEAWHHSTRTGDVFEIENRARRRDGVYHWFLTRGIPIKGENGKITKWYGTATDIHDLRALQIELEAKVKERTEQLRQSEETYRFLFELNLAGVYRGTLDPVTHETKLLEYNEAFARIFGYSREELVGESIATTFFSSDERNKYLDHLLEKKKLINYETRRVRKDGKPICTLVNVSLRKIEGSDKMLAEGTVVDITERKEAEEQMRAAHRKLRAMASEMIKTEERERQHMATVLHDTVAQTLAAAKMRFDSLQEYVPVEGLLRMDETRNLLVQSIKQTRSIMAELSPPILYELGFIPALEWLAEQFTEAHGIPIKFDSENGLKTLTHDIEVMLYLAARELLTNVVKHARTSQAEIKVSEDNGDVKIEVRDNGEGMDTAKMGYQGDLSSGFGLFSIRERLKHFGGELDIQSQKGKGTRITMIVPRGGWPGEKKPQEGINER